MRRRALVLTLGLALSISGTVHVMQTGAVPMRIDVSRDTAGEDRALAALIRETRAQADAFVFLSGGASRMSAGDQHQLLAMFGALAELRRSGRRVAVGDGGTQAGIMQAAGEARLASGRAFPLIGIAPAKEIAPRGQTPVDPNHSAIMAVDDPSLSADQDGWGSETRTMYEVFARLAEDRPSVTVVANGGGITLAEVEANVAAGRRMIVVEGSGRAADAVASLIGGTQPASDEVAQLRDRAATSRLTRRPDLFRTVPLSAGAKGLRDALDAVLFGAG